MFASKVSPFRYGVEHATTEVHHPQARILGISALIGFYISYLLWISPYSQMWQAVYRNAGIPDGYSIRGIDISHYQGQINWERISHSDIKGSPICFVFIKTTEGTNYQDEYFEENFRESRRYGLLRGAYHYFKPGESATQQAANFISNTPLEIGDLPPVLDVEEIGNLAIDELREAVLTWLLIVEDRYGVPPILYTNLNFKQRYLATNTFDRYPYWVAHYFVEKPGWNGQWTIWQHTDRGRVPGIQTFVDFDVYDGSMYSLRRLCIKERPSE